MGRLHERLFSNEENHSRSRWGTERGEDGHDWSGATLNLSKTQYIKFGEPKSDDSGDEGSIVMSDTIIRPTSSVKYLGLIIDNKLSWKQHTEHIAKKLTGPIGIILETEWIYANFCTANNLPLTCPLSSQLPHAVIGKR